MTHCIAGTAAIVLLAAPLLAGQPGETPLQVFCGTGDHLWTPEREPVDSPAAIDAMLEWMSQTYRASRLYWRGAQGHLWDYEYRVGPTEPLQYDWAVGWIRHLNREVGINEAAIASARVRGMEIFMYTGLFEHGVQPDIGVVCPYPFEDRLRIEHPEWCEVDRWGERRCPGPLSFSFPEVRQLLARRYADWLARYGYDGITFYTYVENVGIRYPNEFGFTQPTVDEFRRRYPDVDPRRDTLTPEQQEHWYRCRGKFVTDFLRELHAEIAPAGRKLSVILDAEQPDYAQPWWGQPLAGTGMLRMEWEQWIAEGIVDELWVQLGGISQQRATLDRLLAATAGTHVRLTVRTPTPFSTDWDTYIARGVTPVAVITAPANGIERYSLRPTSPETLSSEDWKLRLQTVDDVATGKLQLAPEALVPLAQDPNILVRRKMMYALAALGATQQVAVIEAALHDPESSVRIAAAGALAKVHRPDSANAVLEALGSDGHFQMKLASVEALAGMGREAFDAVVAGSRGPNSAAREVAVRALYRLGKGGMQREVYAPLRDALLDTAADYPTRYFAADGLVGLRLELPEAEKEDLLGLLPGLLPTEASADLQTKIAWGIGYLSSLMPSTAKAQALTALAALFSTYGTDCRRDDAAYGWRLVGNAMLQFGDEGRSALDALRTGRTDPWLAWFAYEVVYAPQRSSKMVVVDEQEAVKAHDAFAPPFPGASRPGN